MKKLFGLFVIGILSSTAMAELVCLAPSGCAIEIETGACPTCVETSIVEPVPLRCRSRGDGVECAAGAWPPIGRIRRSPGQGYRQSHHQPNADGSL